MDFQGGSASFRGVSSSELPWPNSWLSSPQLGKSMGQLPGPSLTHITVMREGVSPRDKGEGTMLSWAVTFLVIALIAAVLGFGGIAGTAAGIAKLLFFIFLAVFVVFLIMGMMARGRTRV
jgi:uncharacterized membrane protein YtjA (UPF0391 family)